MKILKPFYYVSLGFSVVVEFINNIICQFLNLILSNIFKKKKAAINSYFMKGKKHPEYLLLVILYVVVFISIYNLLIPKKVYVKKEIKKIKYQDINTTPITSDSNSEPINDEKTDVISNDIDNNIDLNEYKRQNDNTVAYLIVDDTNIDYPVVQTTDNKYYLEHDFYHNYSLKGAIFADYRSNFNNLSNNTIIYGHHRLDNIMFGELDRLFTIDYFNRSNHMIKLITFNKTYIFDVFSVYEIDPELYYLATSFATLDEYLNFLNIIRNRSQYNFGQTLDGSSKILTLSTCNKANTGRLVVHAVLRSEG